MAFSARVYSLITAFEERRVIIEIRIISCTWTTLTPRSLPREIASKRMIIRFAVSTNLFRAIKTAIAIFASGSDGFGLLVLSSRTAHVFRSRDPGILRDIYAPITRTDKLTVSKTLS